MSSMNVQQLLAQMRVMEAQATAKPPAFNGIENAVPKTDFSNVLKESVNAVNEASQASSKMADAFEKGDPNVSVAQLMITMEKASVSFQAMTQVRNRLLSAYQDVMNMPV
ncbi:MAG: flagellar hook-basal body complex protein FliE [Gammaproteobacteria bacterium]|nr:flagellar hook-basal body complex protein FliE [Gammaproteobacteria bacterium]MCW8910978.1 flagellar hook-basal body complex protein FliE [Gammaproteobacteria bacterium]MCW9005889.1 flagellar hook-basal body complex protein FliE [Gammaproteobacteria bacterium]MCW9056732.1 flagellar hook-basal body complex protein FliE [Gammaproteobacteria bacterium]